MDVGLVVCGGDNGVLNGGSFAAVRANHGGDKVARRERRAYADANGVRNSVWDGCILSAELGGKRALS